MIHPSLAGVIISLGVLLANAAAVDVALPPAQPEGAFLNPPAETGMTVHWVWFGPAATREGIDRDLLAMKKAHISGVTLLPVYPLLADGDMGDFRNQPFLSDDFLRLLAYAARRANELRMSFDLTPGTGWPYGGPWITPPVAARMLRMRKAADPGIAGEQVIARLDDRVFVSVPTARQVKRAALGGEGLSMDHYSAAALQHHWNTVAEKLFAAVRPAPIRAIWCDSLEVYDSNWTAEFPAHFRQRRGYDLTPSLPLLFGPTTPEACQARRDFWLTASELTAEQFFRPLQDLCHQKGVQLRAEPYGQPPIALGACRYVDLPVGEHYDWRTLNATRWSASGGHLFGRNVIDAEAWTWAGLPSRLSDSLEQLKVASDLHFVSGANSLMGVSYPHVPNGAQTEYWLTYWGPVLGERQTWWPSFHLLSRYVQRVSWVLRQGRPVADVGLYLPIDDVFAQTPADRGLNLYYDLRERLHGGPVREFGLSSALTSDSPIVSTLINNGYSFDCIDSSTLPDAQVDGGRLKMGLDVFALIVLPAVQGMPLADIQKLARFVESGGKLVATRRLPDVAYGLKTHEADTLRLRRLVADVFAPGGYGKGRAVLARDERDDYLAALKRCLSPDLRLEGTQPDLAFAHRRLADRDFYFLANLGKHEKTIKVGFAVSGGRVRLWDPMSGSISEGWDGVLHLEPYGSIIAETSAGNSAQPQRWTEIAAVNLPGPWVLRMPGHEPLILQQPRYWTDMAKFLHFSGTGSYSSTFEIKLEAQQRVVLDLGEVREVAEVRVNGKAAGVAWMQPYRLDITEHLASHQNQIEIRVTNLLLNSALGQPAPDYSSLHRRFGQRFPDPAEWKECKPLPSGLPGQVKLRILRPHDGK